MKSVDSVQIRNASIKPSDARMADARPAFRRPKIVLPVPTPALKFQKVQPEVPDTQLTREATGLLREFSTPSLFNHSHRVFFWASELGRKTGKPFDAELLFVSAAFHDLGLLKKFSSADDRFEVDSANAARQFLEHTTTFRLPGFKWLGTQSLCIPLRVLQRTSHSRWSFCTTVSASMCWVSAMSTFRKI